MGLARAGIGWKGMGWDGIEETEENWCDKMRRVGGNEKRWDEKEKMW